jgi:hypothetical protein
MMKATASRLLLMVVVFSLTRCTSWTVTQSPVITLDGRRVRLTTESGERHDGLLLHPDTMGSRVLLRAQDASHPLVIDTSTVITTEIRRLNEGRTVGLMLLGVGAVVFTIVQIKMIFNDVDY